MRERRQPRAAKLGSHIRRANFPFHLGWNRPWGSARTPLEGRLGTDLHPRTGGYIGPRVRGAKRDRWRVQLPWRHQASVPQVRRPLAREQQLGRRRIQHPALLGLAIVQGLLVGVAIWALTSPVWQVRRVQVQGTEDAVVARAIQALPLTGCNIFRCDLTRAAQLVEELPAVAHAEAHAVYPDGIAILVRLRQPVALWRTAAGAYVVAEDGIVLGALESDPIFAGLGLVEVRDEVGLLFGGRPPLVGIRVDAALVAMATQVHGGMDKSLGGDWALTYNEQGFVAVRPDGRRVLFGVPRDAASAADGAVSASALGHQPSADELAQGVHAQLHQLRAILALLQSRGQQATLIDLRWGTHPYYRLEGT